MKCAWNELLRVIPPRLRNEVDERGRDQLQEIRLRYGKEVQLHLSDGCHCLPYKVGPEDIKYVINAASQYSLWTAATISQGYITAPGGHRIGLCGQALIRNEKMNGLQSITSVNIRVSRDFTGICGDLWLRKGGILIIGPPGSGKTTLLRDLIRHRACRENVAVVDERAELFPTNAAFDTGAHTDVLTGCTKAEGVSMVLRVMNPSCIAVDEITAEADCEALLKAGWCGVSLLATAHASDLSDLSKRAVYAPLIDSGLFETTVILRRDKSWHIERIL